MALSVIVLIVLLVYLLFSTIVFFLSFAGFLGEWPMVLSAVVSLLAWGTFIALTIYAVRLVASALGGNRARLDQGVRWTRGLSAALGFGGFGVAWLLGLGAFAACGPLWLSSLYHWGGLVMSLVAFAFLFVLPPIARACGESAHATLRWWPLVVGLSSNALSGLAWFIIWILLRGSIDESLYPARSSSLYRLPFPGGESAWVIQGNNSSFNHEGDEEHAWDFRRRCGTPVLAARDGTVTKVQDKLSGHDDNNMIEVTHGDGTVGRYLHIQQNSATRAKGDTVRQGDELAKVGNVGNSMTGHIHFVVESGGKSIPVTFRDVSDDGGVPRTFGDYRSGNRR